MGRVILAYSNYNSVETTESLNLVIETMIREMTWNFVS
jgi:hypothetical protein